MFVHKEEPDLCMNVQTGSDGLKYVCKTEVKCQISSTVLSKWHHHSSVQTSSALVSSVKWYVGIYDDNLFDNTYPSIHLLGLKTLVCAIRCSDRIPVQEVETFLYIETSCNVSNVPY